MFRTLRRIFRRDVKDFRFAGRWWTWAEAAQGLIAFGGIGSGKSFSTEDYIRAMIGAGCPALVTCVKVNEFDRYERIAKKLGCTKRLVRITPEEVGIDMMAELMRDGATPADAATFLLMLSDIEKLGNGGDNAAFWRSLEEGCLRYAILLCMRCGLSPTLDRIYNIILSAPNRPNQGDVNEDGIAKNPEYDFDTPAEDNMRLFPKLMRQLLAKSRQKNDLLEYNRIYKFFLCEFCATDKIHGSLLASINGTLGRFVDAPLRNALTQTTLTPKMIEDNKLIAVIDYPLMRYHTAGRLFACIWVMLTQRYLMARSASKIKRPFIIVRDEAGWCLHAEWDAKAHNTLRSQKVVDIAIVQDLDTLQAALGATKKSEHEAMAFASNHMHKLFFSNYSHDTNEWASKLSGMYQEVSISSGHNEAEDFMGKALGARTPSYSFHYQPVVRPEHFNQLPVGHAYLMSNGQVRYINFRGKK